MTEPRPDAHPGYAPRIYTEAELPQVDPGIQRAVTVLLQNGIETFESCEGGPGHSCPEPSVRFYGNPAAGWRAVAICHDYGLPILSLRRIWIVLNDHEPTGPYWEITFWKPVP